MLQPGDKIGRYEIQAAIGEGGFGQVYRAWDPELARAVAIKELAAERQGGDPSLYAEYQERFKLERRVQGQFQHPHIVSAYDLVQQDGNEYLVEELVEGGTLRDLLQREKRLPPERVVQIGVEMCQAIAATWKRNIVHRDIKPGNILLTGDGHAKLGDFGVAQVGQLSQRTQSPSRHPGTPAYMSPEQESGAGYLDERSDIYSLGLTLYEALTSQAYKRERVPVRQLAPNVPRRLEAVVMRALARERDERYPSAAEFEAALRDALRLPRPGVIGWIGGLVLIIVVGGLALALGARWRGQVTPTPTMLMVVSTTPEVVTTMPAASPSATVVIAPASTPTATSTATRRPTLTPALAAPRLLSPPGAGQTTQAQVTFQWAGTLPDSSYGFRVDLRHESGKTASSPLLDSRQWTFELPEVGEWRWSVAIVRRANAQAAMRSGEWTLYYNPFPGPFVSPFASPLPTP